MTGARRSILAEMALRFVDQRETLATAGLGHLMQASSASREALRIWLSERSVTIPSDLAYRIEVVDPEDEGRPDVVGLLGDQRHVILEGKFWAALTDAQPVGYLRSLQDDGCLLVVAPELRFETVGAELVRRCGTAGLPVADGSLVMRGGISRVAQRWWLGMVSWRTLLGRLQVNLNDAGEIGLAADVEQLMSLSDLEDQEAFLPLTAVDLSTPTPQRVYQFMELVEAVCRRGEQSGLLQRGRLKTGGGMGQYLRYIAAGPIQLAIFVDLKRWSRRRLTPLWAEAAVLRGSALANFEAAVPSRVFYDGHKGRPVFPLDLPLHLEHDQLVDHLHEQLRDIVRAIEGCVPTVQVGQRPSRSKVESGSSPRLAAHDQDF